jgi:hypothetical protein
MGAKVAVERGFPFVDREIQRRQSSPTDFGLAAKAAAYGQAKH